MSGWQLVLIVEGLQAALPAVPPYESYIEECPCVSILLALTVRGWAIRHL